MNVLEQVGGAVVQNFAYVGGPSEQFWAGVRALPRVLPMIGKRGRWQAAIRQMAAIGVAALPMIAIMAASTGMILALQGAAELRRFDLRCGKSKKSKRYLPISDRMVEELKRLVAGRTQGWLLVSDSRCGHLTTVSKMFAIARKRARLPNSVVLYSARHTFGTDVLEGTKNPAVTMDVMGHTNPKMMMRYQHPEYTRAARQAINRRNLRNGFGPNSGPTQKPRCSSERLSALESGADDQT